LAGEIAHGERSHRHAEFGHDGIDLLRQGTFEQQLLRLLAALRQHAVADKTVADADHRRHFCNFARDRNSSRESVGRSFFGAHDLAQLHDIGR
jgi:hypothetical protein